MRGDIHQKTGSRQRHKEERTDVNGDAENDAAFHQKRKDAYTCPNTDHADHQIRSRREETTSARVTGGSNAKVHALQKHNRAASDSG